MPERYGKGIAITGPAGSGKTRRAVAEINRAIASSLWDGKDDTVIIAKHPRGEPVGKPLVGNYSALLTDNPDDIAVKVSSNTRAVFIDGADSFETRDISRLTKELILSNRRVYIIGNSMDWEGRPRNFMPDLMARCDEFWTSSLSCDVTGCNHRATRSQPKGDRSTKKCIRHHYPGTVYHKEFDQMGSFIANFGSMFGDKTNDWCGEIENMVKKGIPHVVFKSIYDNRHDRPGVKYAVFDKSVVTTNDGRTIDDALIIDTAVSMRAYLERNHVGTVFVDEGWLIPGIAEFVRECLYKGYRFHITGLLRDFRMEPLGVKEPEPGEEISKDGAEGPKLLCMADEIRVGHGFCVKCRKYRASESQRIIEVDGVRNPARYDDPIVKIGGKSSYEARCRPCVEFEGGIPASEIKYNFEPFDEIGR